MTTKLPRLRELAVAGLLFIALSAAFQVRGLSPDGLLSRVSFFGGSLLGRPGFPRFGTALDFGSFDYVRYLAPYASFIQRELTAWRLPLWNPYVGTGVPVVEAMSPALLHPFTLSLLVLPFEQALSALAVLRLAPAGLGTFLLARVLGCGRPASILAGSLYMLSTFHLGFRFHPLPNVSSFLPFLLVLSELRLRGGSARRCGAVWSLVGALMLVGGHAETSVHSFGVAWVYHLLRATAPPAGETRWRSAGGALVFLTISTMLAGLGAAAAVWGHTEAVLRGYALRFRSSLPHGYPGEEASHLLSFLAPVKIRPSQYPAYLGIVTLLLAVRGLFSRNLFPAWPWVVIGVGALFSAYGLWPVGSMLGYLPLLGTGIHSRLIFVVHLALALLAARGLAVAVNPRTQRATTMACCLIALCLAWLWVAGDFRGPRGWWNFPLALTVPGGALLVGSALLSRACRRVTGRAWAWLAIGVVLTDLYGVHGPRPRQIPAAFPERSSVLRLVDGPPEDGRVFLPDQLLTANVNMIYGIPSIAVYEPALGRDVADLLLAAGLKPLQGLLLLATDQPSSAGLRLLNLLNVRYLLTRHRLDEPLAGQLQLLTDDPIAVYRNPHALPRAFVVEQAIGADNRPHALSLLRNPRIDLSRAVILERPLPAQPPPRRQAGKPRSSAEILDYHPGETRIAVSTPSGGYLVFTESFASGWRATIDGRPAPVLRGDYCLITVAIPPGHHEVTLRYRPQSVIIGGVIAMTTIAILIGAALLPTRSRYP